MRKATMLFAAAMMSVPSALGRAVFGGSRISDWKHSQERLAKAEYKRYLRAQRNLRNANK